jgi:hypothetical protein
MRRIAVPKTVLTPGIETGTRKIMEIKMVSNSRQSFPTMLVISIKFTSLGGILRMSNSIFRPSDSDFNSDSLISFK